MFVDNIIQQQITFQKRLFQKRLLVLEDGYTHFDVFEEQRVVDSSIIHSTLINEKELVYI